MQQSINEVKESIQEAELSTIEYGNSAREALWGIFDYLQDRISTITDEADFLVDLLSNTKLYTDNGQLTDTGKAAMGLHGQSYNVYMQQADEYAEELLKLDEEIANDPYNTQLIERREELLDLQRQSIASAQSERQAIVEMVEQGIELELDALQKLIDKRKENLSAAKD